MPKVLTSWKEIAQYLGKGIRTVQRWERLYSLPVRRPGDNHHAILAIPEELDAWIHAQRPTRRSELEDLRREVTALRAENARLKKQLAHSSDLGFPANIPQPNHNGNVHFDQGKTTNHDGKGARLASDLLARSSQLITEIAQIGERTQQVLARSRRLLSAASQPGSSPRTIN
jgi:hypothetical protein